ncbi:hypothetical protein LR48_Vigan07g065700 [Vigna angularis]|uniref:Myb/SANT-like domain-containing protein n=1 Tax=Phaseolus angularis TaxID=3914 RepID=A0A0L9UW34_PHAAN|nr:hypothetical protein LR48_Vigan07g065700 [Vigna angularis]
MEEELDLSYLDREDIDDDVVGVDFNIVAMLHQQLQLTTSLAALTMLCIVCYALNILNMCSSDPSCVSTFLPDKDRRRQQLMSYLVHTNRCRDIIRMGAEAFINLCERLRTTGINMDRGNGATIESSAGTREFIKWTEDMDARLLHSMIEETRLGNRIDGSWTTQAYNNMVQYLHSCGYVNSKPSATKWRVNSIRHYDLMVELFAADRAIESGVRTARQTHRQREYRDPTPPSPPPSVDEYSPGQTQSVPSVPSGGTSSSRGSKRKAPMVDMIDAQFDKLTTSLDGFTNVLDYTNVHFGVISGAAVRQVSAIEDINQILRRTSMYTYTEDDIYEMLSAMNIADENLLDQCYDFLCSNPTCTKRLMRLPPHKRWNKLCKMISGDEC